MLNLGQVNDTYVHRQVLCEESHCFKVFSLKKQQCFKTV